MAESQRNYTPIATNGARHRGSFLTSAMKKNIAIVGSVFVLVALVSVGMIALKNPKILTTPAQTVINAPICPADYREIIADATNPGDMTTLCPGGDIVIVDGSTAQTSNLATNPGGAGSTGGGAASSTGGDAGSSGDAITISKKIVCCRLSIISPTVTPTQNDLSGTPVLSPSVTPPASACVIPNLVITNVTLDCPDCTQQ